MDKTPNKSQSSLLGIFINILLPVLILDYCSAGPAPASLLVADINYSLSDQPDPHSVV